MSNNIGNEPQAVPCKAKCWHCGSQREIGNCSQIIIIGTKPVQYIPAHSCPKCGKLNSPTFYKDIAEELSSIAEELRKVSKKQAIKYTVLMNSVFLPIGWVVGWILNWFLGL